MGKYAIYAVAQGISPTTGATVTDLKFNDWQSCAPYVKGVRFARYKGFMTETEADEWLIQEGYKRSQYPALEHMHLQRMPGATVTQESMRFSYPQEDSVSAPKATPVSSQQQPQLLNYQSGDLCNGIKFMFSERCMDLGLDPNEILLYLMEQWLDLVDKMGVALKKDNNTNVEDEDDPPW